MAPLNEETKHAKGLRMISALSIMMTLEIITIIFHQLEATKKDEDPCKDSFLDLSLEVLGRKFVPEFATEMCFY